MTDQTPRARGSGMKALLAWVIILGLAGVVAWLASERNARTWFLVPDADRLVVMRGVLLPVGRRAFTTSDPALAAAYAPLAAPPGKSLPAERSFEERSLLDQGLFDLLAAWARDEISSGDPARLERGLGFLARAERLAGISSSQRDELLALRAESGYHEATRLLESAARELRDAAEKLRLAAGSRSSHALDAQLLLKQVDPAIDTTLAALRASGRLRPAEPASPPAPTQDPAAARTPAQSPELAPSPPAQPAPAQPAGNPGR
jgi:hypothetical protein